MGHGSLAHAEGVNVFVRLFVLGFLEGKISMVQYSGVSCAASGVVFSIGVCNDPMRQTPYILTFSSLYLALYSH